MTTGQGHLTLIPELMSSFFTSGSARKGRAGSRRAPRRLGSGFSNGRAEPAIRGLLGPDAPASHIPNLLRTRESLAERGTPAGSASSPTVVDCADGLPQRSAPRQCQKPNGTARDRTPEGPRPVVGRGCRVASTMASNPWRYPRNLIDAPGPIVLPRGPLQLYERGIWDPAEQYWGEPEDTIAA